MNFHKQLSGDQQLRFAAGGTALRPKGTKLQYRLITTQADWKKVWGYLYDDTVKVDFKKYRVLAIYKSPAKGGFSIKPKKVYSFENDLSVDLDVIWNGKPDRSHPFLFLVIDKFKKLDVNEKFVAPTGKEVKYP